MEFVSFRSPGLSAAFLDTRPISSLRSWAQAQPSRPRACPGGPCLCEKRFLAFPGHEGPSDPTEPSEDLEGQALGGATQQSPGGMVPSVVSSPSWLWTQDVGLGAWPGKCSWHEALGVATTPARWVQTNQCHCGYGSQECPLPAQGLASG